MKISLKELKVMVKSILTETYLGGTSNFHGLDSAAFNKAGSVSPENPLTKGDIDEVALTEKILDILLSIPNIPRSGEFYSDISVSDNEIAVVIRPHLGSEDTGYPIGDFGDKAFNHAAAEAALVLVDDPDDLEGAAKMCARGLISPDAEYDRASTRLYESKLILMFPGE